MKGWMWGVLSAVVGGVLTVGLLALFGTFQQGQDALTDMHIRSIAKQVVSDELTTDSGDTVGKLVSEMNLTLGKVETEVRMQGEMLKALTD